MLVQLRTNAKKRACDGRKRTPSVPFLEESPKIAHVFDFKSINSFVSQVEDKTAIRALDLTSALTRSVKGLSVSVP